MQKIADRCAKRFHACFSSRTFILVLTFFVMAFLGNVHTRWAKSLFYFFVLPVQIGMAYVNIRDRAIRMDGVFKLVCVSLIWLLGSQMLNSAWSISGMNTLWTLFGCWIFALFIPKTTSIKSIHDEIFKVGMVFIVCFMPIILIALYSVFSGKVIHLPWEHTAIGLQKANSFGSRIRIMMNPNKAGIILVLNILFSIYGLTVRKGKFWRAFFIFNIFINTLASAHTQSRTCIMGLAAAMGLFAFRFIYQKLERKKALRIVLGVLACVLVFLLIVYGMNWLLALDTAIAERINHMPSAVVTESRIDEFGAFDALSSGRDKIWKAVFQLFKEKPSGLAVGYGAENVMDMLAEVSGNAGLAEMVHVHSAYLDAIVRGGIPYLLMVVAFLLLLVKPAWQLGMEKSTAETKGLFVVPMVVVALLVMSVSEVMLFVHKEYPNFLFMMMCGYLLHYKNLRKEGKLENISA